MKCRFYIVHDCGHQIEWRGLTRTQARNMYAWTVKFRPEGVNTFGWEDGE